MTDSEFKRGFIAGLKVAKKIIDISNDHEDLSYLMEGALIAAEYPGDEKE